MLVGEVADKPVVVDGRIEATADPYTRRNAGPPLHRRLSRSETVTQHPGVPRGPEEIRTPDQLMPCGFGELFVDAQGFIERVEESSSSSGSNCVPRPSFIISTAFPIG